MIPALSICHLQKTYPNGVQALQNIDLAVAPGDFFALLGPNGAGKSTAIGIICSLVKKTAGTVAIFGHDIDREPAAAKACIGLVPQEFNFNIFEPTIEICVNQAGYYGVPYRIACERAEHYLNQLGLWEKRREPARALSGGMKRRLMIARALLHEPRLLILDEPTAGVDIELRHSMWEFVQGINASGTTIILTTHYLEEAERLCRNVAIIDHGHLIEHASVRELLNRLQRQSFMLDVRGPLEPLPFLPGVILRVVEQGLIEVEMACNTGMNGIFAALSAAGIEVLSLRNKTNRLEELFLNLVQRNGESV